MRVASRDGWRLGTPYTPQWSLGRPVLPDLQVVTLLTPSEQRRGAKLAAVLAVDDEEFPLGPSLLVYSAHDHHKLTPSTQSSNLVVHVTDHAVAVEDRREKRWSWAFVMTGRSRLRIPSIGRPATDGAVIAVELVDDGKMQGQQLVVIDPQSGRSAWRDGVNRWTLGASGLQINDQALSGAQLAKLLAEP